MKSLFKRIYSLALHPNGFKRLGAALAFNSVYRLFRWAAGSSGLQNPLQRWLQLRDAAVCLQGGKFLSGPVCL